MSNVAINIAAEYTGKPAFDKANKSVMTLERNVKKLAAGVGVGLGLSAISFYGKAAVKAFVADEEAATKLANAVKNLGMEFANPYIADYISKLEATSKVADDQLRPAFQALLQQTGNLSASQSILNTAIETSRGSGVDLATVANDLAQAYVGNTKGLKKYYLGLTTAQIKAKSFTEIQKIMNDQFAGSNTAYLNTYSGQVGVLSLAWQNFQEKVGGTLLTLASFGDGENGHKLNLLAATLDKIGSAIELIGKGKEAIFGLFDITGKGGLLSKFNPFPQGGASAKPKDTSIDKYSAILKQIEEDRAKQNAIILKNQKTTTAELKKQSSLKKSGSVFDMEQIQRIAALKGKLSEEDRTRVEAQLALLNDNDVLAKKLTDQILDAQDKSGRLKDYFYSIGDTKINNPFAFLDKWVIDFQAKLNTLKLPEFKMPDLGAIVSGFTPPSNAPSWTKQPGDSAFIGPVPLGNSSNLPVGGGSAYAPTYNSITVNGSILTDQMLTDLIQNGLQGASLSGSPSQIGRIQGMFNG